MEAVAKQRAVVGDAAPIVPRLEVVKIPISGRTGQKWGTQSRWWTIVDLAVFGVWSVLVGMVVQRHEPWADEAQSWLLARDLSFKTLWFHELRYNGTPGLWHTILWIAQHAFHAPYSAMSVIGVLCAGAGVALLIWESPFPRILTYLLALSYFLVYQYAVVARSYNLMPLVLFAAAMFYADRSRPIRMTAALMLLANISFHGTLMAAGLGFCYLLEARKVWGELGAAVRRKYFYCVAAMMLTFVFVYIVVRQTPDVAVFLNHRPTQPVWMRAELNIAYAFVDQPILSAVFLVLAGAWCWMRRKFLPFAILVSSLLVFLVLVYGRPHHVGTLFLAAIAGLWIAWPTAEQWLRSSKIERMATYGMGGLLACVLCVNVWDAAVAIRNDYLYPYCGSSDAANYLKRIGADKSTIFGYTYGTAAVQAYFDHNILANSPTTYYHEGLPLYASTMDLGELQRDAPEYVIIYSNDGDGTFHAADPALRALGYELVHFSPGDVFFKRFVFDTANYYIYRLAALNH